MATRDVTLRHCGGIPPLPNSKGARSLYTRASITLSRWRRSANNMLQDFIIIGQSNIPISTAAPTHYVRFYTHTYFLYHLKKILGPFLAPLGLLSSTFRFPFFRYVSTYFFRRFDFFLTSFFKVPSSIYIQV